MSCLIDSRVHPDPVDGVELSGITVWAAKKLHKHAELCVLTTWPLPMPVLLPGIPSLGSLCRPVSFSAFQTQLFHNLGPQKFFP